MWDSKAVATVLLASTVFVFFAAISASIVFTDHELSEHDVSALENMIYVIVGALAGRIGKA